METQHQNTSVLSVSKSKSLHTCQFKTKTPVSTFQGNSNIQSYNKANHTDSPLARLPGVGGRYVALK